MGTTRKIVGWLPYLGAMLVMIAAFEWVDYHHLKGFSWIWGHNPRCLEPQYHYCMKLDTSNMPWDATLATWLGQGLVYLAILAGVLAGVAAAMVLLSHVVTSPPQERLSRLAHSGWLSVSAVSLTVLLIGAAVTTLVWAQRDVIVLLTMLTGNVLVHVVYFRVEGWASRYRLESFLAHHSATVADAD